MEEQWIADRAKLRALWLEHPEWSKQQLAEATGRSRAWVKKWLRRIRSRPLEDQEVLHSLSRARKHPPERIAEEVVNRILEIRDDPPPKLGRIPGPLTILYYLQKDPHLAEAGYRLPRSTRTIWRILDQHHCIPREEPRQHEPLEPVEPGVEWGMDFYDVSSVPADPPGKQQHVVEILNIVDHGSSAVVASEPGDAYTAETGLRKVAEILQEKGCPSRIDIDRDPRWVGSWTAEDFPSPWFGFCSAWELNLRSALHTSPRRTPTSNGIIATSSTNAKRGNNPPTWRARSRSTLPMSSSTITSGPTRQSPVATSRHS